MENDEEFLQEFGFKKDAEVDVDESISKFSSHAAYEPQLPTKSELMRTDSNAISEENIDYNTANMSSANDTEKVDENEEMEDFILNASNADIGFLKQSLTNIQEMMAKEVEEQKAKFRQSQYETKKKEIVEDDNESDEDYGDDFEEINEEIEDTGDHKDVHSGDDSIEEDLNLDIDEDEDSDSDAENQMEKFKTQKDEEDEQLISQNQERSGINQSATKKRAISAKYQLQSKSSKATLPKKPPAVDKSMKSNVLEALKEENKRVGQEEIEKRFKAETKKSRPFSNLSSREKIISSKTKKPNLKANYEDLNVNYHVDETSSNTDLDRQTEKETISEYPRGSHPTIDTQMRKTDIIKKIERLSDTQRHQLFFLLEQMENGENIDKIDMKFLSPKPAMVKHQKQYQEDGAKMVSERTHKNELRIRVLSTWGHIQVGGLTEIELFDQAGNKVILVPADIIIKNANKILCDQSKLINNHYLTTDERKMWLCSLPNYK